jgi:hypothetical protein
VKKWVWRLSISSSGLADAEAGTDAPRAAD